MIKQVLLVGIGGAIGSILRFLTSTYMIRLESFPLPIGTFAANIVGCFLIGLFSNLLPQNNLRFLFITGFCGGFTTFSTFSNETFMLATDHHLFISVLYVVLTIVVGLFGVYLGMRISR